MEKVIDIGIYITDAETFKTFFSYHNRHLALGQNIDVDGGSILEGTKSTSLHGSD